MRFLRKRYKDPMNRDPKTGQERDFKFLHLQDVQMSSANAPTRGMVAAADLASADPGLSSTEVQAGAPGALNNTPGMPGSRGPSSIASQSASTGDQPQTPDQASTNNGPTPPAPQPLSQRVGPGGAPQVFGGGAITGVASTSKEKTIRVFNKKDHYNQWQFIYDPGSDRGGLLNTPAQPPLQNAVQNVQPAAGIQPATGPQGQPPQVQPAPQ